MRKHARHTHVHTHGSERMMYLTPEPEPFSRTDALRAVGAVVYAVRVGQVIKIGHTANLARRCWDLKATDVLAFMPGTYDDEQAIHARLVDHLQHGREWYYPTPGVLAVVNEIRATLGLTPVAA